MLDDLKMIHNRDSGDALGVAIKAPRYLLHEADTLASTEFSSRSAITTIVFYGPGVAALVPGFVRVWPGVTVSLEAIGWPTLPSYVGSRTVVVIADYSSDHNGALSVLRQAIDRKAEVIVIASAGRLAEAAQLRNCQVIAMAAGLQEGQLFSSYLGAVFAVLRLIGTAAEPPVDMPSIVRRLSDKVALWSPMVPTIRNQAKQIALELAGKTVVLASGPRMAPAAQAWKMAINANAKQLAWCSWYPAAGPGLSETASWTKQPVIKLYAAVDIRSDFEELSVRHFFEHNQRLLSGLRPSPVSVQAEGESVLEHMLWATYLGELVSIYLALLAGTDPKPAEVTIKLQKELL